MRFATSIVLLIHVPEDVKKNLRVPYGVVFKVSSGTLHNPALPKVGRNELNKVCCCLNGDEEKGWERFLRKEKGRVWCVGVCG